MKKILRIIAAVIILAAIAFWLATGANRGWTKNQVPIKITDPVTGIEGVQWKKTFVPGVDFLVAAALISCVSFGASFAFRSKPTTQHQSKTAVQNCQS